MFLASSTISFFSFHSLSARCEFSQPKRNRQPQIKAACFIMKLLNTFLLILALDKPKIGEVEANRKTEYVFFQGIVLITSFQVFQGNIHRVVLIRCQSAGTDRQCQSGRCSESRKLVIDFYVILSHRKA